MAKRLLLTSSNEAVTPKKEESTQSVSSSIDNNNKQKQDQHEDESSKKTSSGGGGGLFNKLFVLYSALGGLGGKVIFRTLHWIQSPLTINSTHQSVSIHDLHASGGAGALASTPHRRKGRTRQQQT